MGEGGKVTISLSAIDEGVGEEDGDDEQKQPSVKEVDEKRVGRISDAAVGEAEEDPTLTDRQRFLRSQHVRQLHKDRVKRPTLLQTLFQQKNVDRSQYYFTCGRKVDLAKRRDVVKEPTPFWYPPDSHEISYKVVLRTWLQQYRKEQTTFPVSKRPSYRSRQSLDLLERLYMSDEELDVPNIPAMKDIDPEFFSVVKGRPEIKERFDIRKYIDDVRQTLLVRLQTGYNSDQVLQVDEQFRQEQKRIDKITDKLQMYVDCFESFLSEDHKESMDVLRNSQEHVHISVAMNAEYKRLERLLGALRCSVYILEEHWRDSKMFQDFLYQVSPMSWRSQYDFYMKHPSDDTMVEDVTLFGRYRLASTGTIASLESLIDMFREDTQLDRDPQLYFTDPSELLAVFDTMERQNLNTILHLEENSVPLKHMIDGLERTKLHFENEVAVISYKVGTLREAIEWEEDRAKALEEEAHELIDGLFKNLIIDDDVLNLYIYVEDAYEATIAPNDNNMGLLAMTRALEARYEDNLTELDYLPPKVVYSTEKEIYSEDVRRMRAAMDATRKVHQMERLTIRLRRSLAPPPITNRRRLIFRSKPPDAFSRREKKEQELTQDQIDFLDFFTDYCRYTDDYRAYFPNTEKVQRVESTLASD